MREAVVRVDKKNVVIEPKKALSYPHPQNGFEQKQMGNPTTKQAYQAYEVSKKKNVLDSKGLTFYILRRLGVIERSPPPPVATEKKKGKK